MLRRFLTATLLGGSFWGNALVALAGVNLLASIIMSSQDTLPVERNPQDDLAALVRFVPDTQLNLADVPVNNDATFRATLVNHAREPVIITSLSTSCGCTDIDIQRRTLGAGQSVQVAGTMKGRIEAGPTTVRINLSLKGQQSGRSGNAELLVVADIVAKITVNPTRVVLEPEPESRSRAFAEVKVQNTTDRAITVKLARGELPGLIVEDSEREIAPLETAAFRVSVPHTATKRSTFWTPVS